MFTRSDGDSVLAGQKLRLCHLLRGKMQTSSAAGHLYQRDGSIYLTKVFATDNKLRGALPLKEKGELKFPFWIVLQFSQQEGNLYVSHVY